MFASHNRAFKEWDVSCKAMRAGQQTLLIRKGGIREEGGTFTITDSEFFLMPTFDHQDASLLQPAYLPNLEESRRHQGDPNRVRIDTYAVVDTIREARDDDQVNALADEMIWNPRYVKMRFDFNPYDPLYLILLRIYNLPEPVDLPMLPAYTGCKSWVTLDRCLSTEAVVPAISDSEFDLRRTRLLERLR